MSSTSSRFLIRRGKYFYERWRDPGGRVRWRSTHCVTRQAARLWITAHPQAGEEGGWRPPAQRAAPPPAVSLGEFWREYQENCLPVKAPATQANERSVLPRVIAALGPRSPLSSLTARVLEDYRARRLGAGLTRRTCNLEVSVTVGMIQQAAHRGYLAEAQVPRVRPLREDRREARWLTAEQARRLIGAAYEDSTRLGRLVEMALLTGLRRTELFNLEWTDFDLERGQLIIGPKVGFIPKSRRARTIPIGVRLLDLLAEIPRGSRYLFCSPRKGGQFAGDVNGSYEQLRRAAERAGVGRIGWHTLRHTYGALLVMAGVPMRAVAELLGHSSMRVTMIYAHVSDATLRNASERVEELLDTRAPIQLQAWGER